MHENNGISARQAWMAALAKAPCGLLADAWGKAELTPDFEWLRAPEIGTVMVRGATGGTGAAFNLGEMTVTRCTLRLNDGTVGHAYVPGRDQQKAEIAALCDAMLQTEHAPEIHQKIIDPIRRDYHDRRTAKAEKAAATKVDFFTLVRGED